MQPRSVLPRRRKHASVGVGNAQANASQRASVGSPNLRGFVAGRGRAIRDTDSVVPHAPQTAVPRMRVARSAKLRGTAAPVATKMRSAAGGRRAFLDGFDEVGQERRCGLHERSIPIVERAQRACGIPHRLNDLRNAHDDREPHAVEETGLMRERRRDEDRGLRLRAPSARLPSRRRASERRYGAARPLARPRFPT